jgi:hypothetical protein
MYTPNRRQASCECGTQCCVPPHSTIGLRAPTRFGYKAPTTLRIAFPREVCYTQHLSSASLPARFLDNDTAKHRAGSHRHQQSAKFHRSGKKKFPCKGQLIHSCLQISTSHKQSLESWTSTQDALNSLITLVRRCSERDFEMGSELQQPLSDLQRCTYLL